MTSMLRRRRAKSVVTIPSAGDLSIQMALLGE